jgi:hypothetical protein
VEPTIAREVAVGPHFASERATVRRSRFVIPVGRRIMTSPSRRFVGSLVLVIFLLIYVFFAVAIGDVIVATKPGWVQFVYFLVAGFLWAAPAAVLVKWMYAPVRPKG